MATIVWYVESGTGERLSDEGEESMIRPIAMHLGERLCRRITDDDGTLEADELVFDYGVRVAPVSDDVGNELCDECGAWLTGELISSEHEPSCSLYPDNIV